MIKAQIASAIGAAGFTAVAIPPAGGTWQDLGWSVLSAVLATVLTWLTGLNKK